MTPETVEPPRTAQVGMRAVRDLLGVLLILGGLAVINLGAWSVSADAGMIVSGIDAVLVGVALGMSR